MLQKLYAENGRTLAVIGISMDFVRGMDSIREYIRDHAVTFPVVQGDMLVAMNYLGITPQRPQFHVPVFFFVGPDGQILEERNADHLGNKEWFANLEENLEASVRRLLPPDKPASKTSQRARKAARKPGAAKAQNKPQ